VETTTFKESLEKWFNMNRKELEQEGIIVHRKNSEKPRVCSTCHNKLRINVNSLKIYCSNCGYIEPCHLRDLTISVVNCSSCPYSPIYQGSISIVKAKKELMKKFRTKRGVLNLGAIQRLINQKIQYSNLKGKCPQSWIPERVWRHIEQ
jgi:predicted RNA-binding Zn-ribbon protein involved in translation (DUF1610 family)